MEETHRLSDRQSHWPLYYYTQVFMGEFDEGLRAIMRDGVIPCSAEMEQLGVPDHVLLSANPKWDPMRARIRPRDERKFLGVARVEVRDDVFAVSFEAFRQSVPVMVADAIASMARCMKADPNDFHYSFDPIPRSSWVSVEIMRDQVWIPASKAVVNMACQEKAKLLRRRGLKLGLIPLADMCARLGFPRRSFPGASNPVYALVKDGSGTVARRNRKNGGNTK